jgi:hypothetical protein
MLVFVVLVSIAVVASVRAVMATADRPVVRASAPAVS